LASPGPLENIDFCVEASVWSLTNEIKLGGYRGCSLLKCPRVYSVAVILKRLNISFYYVLLLVLFGSLCVSGLAFSRWILIIFLIIYCSLLNERNNRLFNDIAILIPRLLDKVKLMTLGWLKAKKITFVFGTQTWWSSPLACLGIGWCSLFYRDTATLCIFLVVP
jgi:hypothetical protein